MEDKSILHKRDIGYYFILTYIVLQFIVSSNFGRFIRESDALEGLFMPSSLGIIPGILMILAMILLMVDEKNPWIKLSAILIISVEVYHTFIVPRGDYMYALGVSGIKFLLYALFFLRLFFKTSEYKWLAVATFMPLLIYLYGIYICEFHLYNESARYFDVLRRDWHGHLAMLRLPIMFGLVFNLMLRPYRAKPKDFADSYDQDGELIPFDCGVKKKSSVSILLACIFFAPLGLIYWFIIRRNLPNRARNVLITSLIGLFFFMRWLIGII